MSADALCDRFSGGVDVEHHDARALLGEQFGGRFADAGGRPGDDGDLVVQPRAHARSVAVAQTAARQQLAAERLGAGDLVRPRRLRRASKRG